MPAVAVKDADPIMVVAPLTFFWTTSVEPLIYALYQLLVLLQRRTDPRFALLKLLIDPLNRTSASVAVGPSTAL